MIICLKTGQAIDVGEVKYAVINDGERVLSPANHCEDGDELLCLSNIMWCGGNNDIIRFTSEEYEFECSRLDIVGIMGDIQ